MRACQRIGQLSRELQKDTSFRGNQHDLVNSDRPELTSSKAKALEEAGISKSTAYEYEEIAGDRDGQGMSF